MPTRKLFNLDGRTALITGGSRGLGLQIAQALGEFGAKVLITARKADELEQASNQLVASGIDAQWLGADGSKPEAITALVDAAMEKLGKIDILVNNAESVI